MRLAGVLLLFAAALPAQNLEIYSEFQRLDPFGNILAVDRSEHPREILSPGLARNAFASFHVVVTAPPGTNYFLYVQANPVDPFRIHLYREQFARTPDGWAPDTLQPIRLPAFGAMPDAEARIDGQTARVFLLDIWVPADAPVRRVRLEVLMKLGDWVTSPMEVRILPIVVPEAGSGGPKVLPSVLERSDAAATQSLWDYLISAPQMRTGEPFTVRDVIRRNADQDLRLGATVASVSPQLLLTAFGRVLDSWLLPEFRDNSGAEWYLALRDRIYRAAALKVAPSVQP